PGCAASTLAGGAADRAGAERGGVHPRRRPAGHALSDCVAGRFAKRSSSATTLPFARTSQLLEHLGIVVDVAVERICSLLEHLQRSGLVPTRADHEVVDDELQRAAELHLIRLRWQGHWPQLNLIARAGEIAHPPRQKLQGEPARFVARQLELGV